MKIENLTGYPLQLGDDRIIGAAGTAEAIRDYAEPELTKGDKERVERGVLATVPQKNDDDKPHEPIKGGKK